jgi:hypothetical protein
MRKRTLALLIAAPLGIGAAAFAGYRALAAPKPTSSTANASLEPVAFRPRSYPAPLLSLGDIHPSKADFSAQEKNGFQPRADRPAWPLALPLDWATNPFKDENWQFQLHAWRMTDPILAEYEKTGDPALFAKALSFALDWATFHYESKKTSPFSYYDMATGIRAMRIAYFLDRAFSGKAKPTEAQMAVLLRLADDHARRLQKASFIASSNHGLFQVHGLKALCRVLGPTGPCAKADAFAEAQLVRLLDTQFSKNGVHREHSPDYHRFAEEAFESFVQPTWYRSAAQVDARLAKARAVFPWYVFPTGRLANLGDTEGTAALDRPSNARCDATAVGCVEVGDFSKDGYAIVRSPWASKPSDAFMLIMTGAYNSTTHKHADDLSFELMEGGQMLFVDAGKYAYLKDPMSRFVASARAHNTVGLSNREIGIRDTKPYGSALSGVTVDDGSYLLKGKVRREKLFSQARELKYVPGKSLLITDTLTSTKAQRYETYLHLSPELKVVAQGKAFVAPLANGSELRIEALSEGCTAELARGQKEPQIQGWVTAEYRKMTEASVITFACPGKDRRIEILSSFSH